MSELTTLFNNIANAIRTKTGSTGKLQAGNFPAEISKIPSGLSNMYGPFHAQHETYIMFDIGEPVSSDTSGVLVAVDNDKTSGVLTVTFRPSGPDSTTVFLSAVGIMSGNWAYHDNYGGAVTFSGTTIRVNVQTPNLKYNTSWSYYFIKEN